MDEGAIRDLESLSEQTQRVRERGRRRKSERKRKGEREEEKEGGMKVRVGLSDEYKRRKHG